MFWHLLNKPSNPPVDRCPRAWDLTSEKRISTLERRSKTVAWNLSCQGTQCTWTKQKLFFGAGHQKLGPCFKLMCYRRFSSSHKMFAINSLCHGCHFSLDVHDVYEREQPQLRRRMNGQRYSTWTGRWSNGGWFQIRVDVQMFTDVYSISL